MRRWLLPCLAVLALVACSQDNTVQFWRPISEPNLLMPLEKVQRKLEFDLSQCKCSIYPDNIAHSEVVEFSDDKQRLMETSAAVKAESRGKCIQQPSLVVGECMRGRGWEPTNCSGRMPLPGAGALCASYTQ
ncbi:MAG: hypothetical protein WAO98_03955 [Alphaproteobacteria bacterium]